jgi:hypothetical protein
MTTLDACLLMADLIALKLNERTRQLEIQELEKER